MMKVEEFQETRLEIAGWPVNLTTYRLGNEWHVHREFFADLVEGLWLVLL